MTSREATPLPRALLSDNATEEGGVLHISGYPVPELTQRFGTPLFVYDEGHIRERCRQARHAFGSVSYAAKAFFNKTMARLVVEESLSIDVASGGELFTALAAGISPNRLVMHGNAKSRGELEMALDAGVGRIVVDGFDELERLEEMVSPDEGVDIMLRVTPGVAIHTHDFVSTGQDDSKFGFTLSTGMAHTAVKRATESKKLRLRGIHLHIGSQVFRGQSFGDAIDVVAPALREWALPEFVLGGGLGVAYVTGETAPDFEELGRVVTASLESAGLSDLDVGIEPGRSIVASAALTVYTVEAVKDLPGIRRYVAVDGGMSDNPRPVLYGSGYEAFDPTNVDGERPQIARIVGKHCESGDILVDDAHIPEGISAGDLLATPVTGAYGHSMGSNYNKIPRPAVVLVNDKGVTEIIRRERYEDLLTTDLG
ncbi:MAG: diaminopimelate decarboxylase [Acidimicrobiia bacterium]|nr:diaminopimelate decarboxylase [Acidimicrobiia bacterium]